MNEPIAVVGSSCRFPGGATSPSKLWTLLENPRDVLKEFSPERLNLKRFYHQDGEGHGSTNVQGRAYLLEEDWRSFDAAFFNINPREAESMDPQQRILLESVYEAMECAGYRLDQMNGSSTSVHVGVMTADFPDLQLRDTETLPTYHATGTHRSILSNRISYFFNLKGPSVTVDTACSSSLVALHQAVQGLRCGDARVAIVAGANLILEPSMFIAESSLHMLSPDSRSRMWDKSANGYARGEGFAALMLKSLSQAIADGDSIEGVIRETGVNSDGRSAKGITNPSSEAQTALIRDTYRRAGLDILKDRCQYFECHGTGTLAGDPVEARAIRDAFFPPNAMQAHAEEEWPLYVGSVKTVIGHLEGCAGLAGVLKALLAVRHRKIPPNMLFSELNPDIAPYYSNMEIPVAALDWPKSSSHIARASVNSFGFGGTNAHVIVESFATPESEQPSREGDQTDALKEVFVGPLLFSAQTELSLQKSVRAHVQFMRENPTMNLERLTRTLQCKRSIFPYKTFFSGSTREKLMGFMQKFSDDPSSSGSAVVHAKSTNSSEQPGILGIFTGQGAQWATMGRALIVSSPLFRRTIERCEAALSNIKHSPNWSLAAELLKDESESRIAEAALSQPLCTAIQLGMVMLLRAAGVKLHAVVGHSSGEIAAVYAAGILDLEAAIRVAYYRGFYAHLACGLQRQSGRMMAVGISYDAALDFCDQPLYKDRLVVAASNSPGSVTLSGDEDVVTEAKKHFDGENTFARVLRTDCAYHSHHMEPCVEPYLEALSGCDIQIQEPSGDCTWISSVRGDADLLENLESLKGQYWVENMRNPVLFSQAVETSLYNGGPFDAALELGPHPALKGPVEQTIKAATGSAPAYAGMMRRGDDEVEAFSGGLGYLWSHLGPKTVDFEGYRAAFKETETLQPPLLKGLPTYAWDHRQPHWRESRVSRRYRLQDDSFHPLLGRRVSDDAETEPRWRNVIKLAELPWIRGHMFQGQALFPGAGYAVMALEAARKISGKRAIKLIELRDIALTRAIVVPDNASGIETVFSLKIENRSEKDSLLAASWSCHFCPNEATADLVEACSGHLQIQYDRKQRMVLPGRESQAAELVPVDMERFYENMHDVGLDYTGLFNGLRSGSRALGIAAVSASWDASSMDKSFMLHPAVIDTVFQALCVAFSSPASGDLWAPYLPIKIGRLCVDPAANLAASAQDFKFVADAYVSDCSSTLITGDIDVFGDSEDSALLQVEGLCMQAMSEPTAENDKNIFAKTTWIKDIMSGLDSAEALDEMADDDDVVEALDRVSLFYWQRLLRDMALRGSPEVSWHHQRMIEAGDYLCESIKNGEHPVANASWLSDNEESITAVFNQYRERADMRLIKAVGESLPGVFKNEKQLLEVMMENDLLNRFYMEGLGLPTINDAIAAAVRQICGKYPQANILEIGAGTGGTTRKIMDIEGLCFASYTYTDISTGFFEKAAEKFSDQEGKIIFKPLNIEMDVLEQDYTKHKYDVIIAANVLHATRSLEETMTNVRTLLKPGGYLILLEITGPAVLRTQFIMGGLPGWWYGGDDDRTLSPAITALQWEELLQRTGFSGVDHIQHDRQDASRHTFSLIVTQAMNDQIALLREPLTIPQHVSPPQTLCIIGGKSLQSSKMIASIVKHLQPWKRSIRQVQSLEDLQSAKSVPYGSSFLFLEELDQPLFQPGIAQSKLDGLQNMLMMANDVLWVTANRLTSPCANMSVGIARSLIAEMPDLRIQHLDLCEGGSPVVNAQAIVDTFLRLRVALRQLDSDKEDALFTIEPELRVISGEVFVQRIQPHRHMNESFNASRRTIQKSISLDEHCVELVLNGHQPALYLRSDDKMLLDRGENLMKVDFSLRLFGDEISEVFLSCGKTDHGGQAVALTMGTSSWIPLDSNLHVLFSQQDRSPNLIVSVAHFVQAAIIRSMLPEEGSIVFQEIPESLAAILVHGSQSERFVFVSSKRSYLDNKHVCLHNMSTARTVKRYLPSDITCLIKGHGAQDLSAVLPSATLILPLGALMKSAGCPRPDQILTWIHEHGKLKDACALAQSTGPIGSIPTYRVHDLITSQTDPNSSFLIDWTEETPHTANLLRTPQQHLLKADRTYLLFGMTGGLGLSITQWMIRNGAKHVALASRSASISASWLSAMKSLGAQVKLYPLDVADKPSLEIMLSDVQKTMPPIAGVCNASMVLQDKLFVDMAASDFAKTIRPKAEGTHLLDEAFRYIDLDFFILFSSLASTIGNAGQSNYHVANLYMSALAAQRRQRGQAASIMHIGLVTDVGYVARKGQAMEDHLRKLFFLPLSEPDMHHAFAEAIKAGKTFEDGDQELIIGIEAFVKTQSATRRPPWEHNPRFGHFVSSENRPADGVSKVALTGDIRQELQQAESEDAAAVLVQDAFCRKLEGLMQLAPNSTNINVPLIDLGCDSLLAIEIRTWFLKQLGMDIPVLKFLSGDTIAELCAHGIKQTFSRRVNTDEQNATEVPKQIPEGLSTTQVTVDVTRASPSSEFGNSDGFDSSSDDRFHAGDSNDVSWPQSMQSSVVTSVGPSTIASSASSIKEESNCGGGKLTSLDIGEPIHMQDSGPASHAQSRLMFLNKYLSDPTTYNVTVAYDIHGELHIPRLKRALAMVTSHHHSLQTRFFEDPFTGALMQGVLESPTVEINILDGSVENPSRREVDRFRNQVWNLESGKTMGVSIVSLGAQHHVIIFGYHHIVLDGFSWAIFLEDLDSAYNMQALRSCGQYLSFSREQEEQDPRALEGDLSYWASRFPTLPEAVPLLPFARVTNRKNLETYESHVTHRVLSKTLVAQIKTVSRQLRITPFHFYLAAIQAMTARLSGSEDICIGVADANRRMEKYERTVGFFLNLWPIRVNCGKAVKFSEIARIASRAVLEAADHSQATFESVLDSLKVPRSRAHSPLFQIALNYRASDVLGSRLGGASMELREAIDARNPYDLSWNVTERTDGCCYLELSTQKQLYSAKSTERMIDLFTYHLDLVSRDSGILVRDLATAPLSVLSDTLDLGRGPSMEYSWPNSLSARFLDTVRRNPDRVAIEDEHGSLTYAKLSAISSSIIQALHDAGGRPGAIIGSLCASSRHSVASMLAVLAIGGTFVPLDGRLPSSRHKAMLRSCKAEYILCQTDTLSKANELGTLSELQVETIDICALSPSETISDISPADAAAFLLFTSGTTGMPKGVEISQASFLNHVALKTEILGINREDVVLQQSSLGFDMSIIQILCALANGGRLVIAPASFLGDPVALSNLIAEKGVTLTIATPSEYGALLDHGLERLTENKAWKQACMGGEKVTQQLIDRFKKLDRLDMRLTNCYGPTEITAAATFHDISLRNDSIVDDEGYSLIGRALPNYSIMIMDDQMRLLPAGCLGEIYIGGAGVARGYYRQPSESAAKFVKNPHASAFEMERGWTRLYRTGDQGRLLEDGTLAFVGRMNGDSLVKLRGLRIDLDEVSNNILTAGADWIAEAATVMTGDPAYLVAHVVLHRDIQVSLAQLQQLARSLPLPQYMLPAIISVIDRLPTTTNGKVDRKALTSLPREQEALPTAEPSSLTLIEGRVCMLWRRVLPIGGNAASLSRDSDFFMHGGDSVALIRIQAAIREDFGLQLAIADLYRSSTLGSMTALIITQQEKRDALVPPVIDWQLETSPPEVPSSRDPKNEAKMQRPLSIILTGALSFLGGAILRNLLKYPEIGRIYCVAIAVAELDELPKSDKICVFTGSLLQPALGLSEGEISELRSSADAVVHAGANGHCLNNYFSLRAPNVQSTRFLAQLAMHRKIPMHYISANRVTLLSGITDLPPCSVASFTPPQDGSEGHTASKWASERLLERVFEKTRLPVCIHRACAATGASAPNEDALNALLKYSVELRCVPRFHNFEGYFDFKNVTIIAREITEQVLFSGGDGSASVRYVHHSSKTKVRVQDFCAHMEEVHDKDFAEVDITDWIKSASSIGLDPLIGSYLEAVSQREQIVYFPYLGSEESD